MKHCATCTCSDYSRPLLDRDALLEVLSLNEPHCHVYRAGSDPNRWFVTYQGGEADPAAVRELINSGQIHSVYDNCPDDAYHVGKTLDTKNTQKANRGRRQRDPKIRLYTDGTQSIDEG